eukprot:570876-Pleurochrysis_carterae.AAC.2
MTWAASSMMMSIVGGSGRLRSTVRLLASVPKRVCTRGSDHTFSSSKQPCLRLVLLAHRHCFRFRKRASSTSTIQNWVCSGKYSRQALREAAVSSPTPNSSMCLRDAARRG